MISGKYEVEKVLGTGMLGATYLTRVVSTGKYISIRALRAELVADPVATAKFKAVFDRVRDLKNDGLLRLGELGEHQGVTWYSQEYVPNSKSLRELIDEYQAAQRSFTLLEACQLVNKVLDAAQYLHENGVVHRNLKPENVIVSERNTGPGGKNVVRTVRITDAALADLISSSIMAETFVSRSEARYLAPELSGFDKSGSPQADVYSIGVMFYELLVGQTPRGTYLSPTQLRGDLPEHVDDVVEIALAPNPEDRYPTARDMLNDIQRSFAVDAFEEKRGAASKTVLVGIGVGVLALAAIGTYFAFREAPDPRLEAKVADETLRRQVQEETRMPSEAELKMMVSAHPEMLYIPPGPFVMGRLNQEDLTSSASRSEPLGKRVEVKGFFIDRFEFPNRMKDGEGKPSRPVAKATWQQAEGACEQIGKRLCGEDEWEKACKGPASWIYSYGDSYDEEMCGQGVDGTNTVGQPETCTSPYGVWGLSGSLREWTHTKAGKGDRRVVKGGLRGNNERGSRCAFAVDEAEIYADTTLGFRCCLDVDSGAAAPAGPPAAETDGASN